jgi:short-subunit dehydrogenase
MADTRTAARADRDSVAGRVVLVTGGSAGIGRVTAQHLARLGASVVIAARDTSRLRETAATLTREHPTTVTAVPADLASAADRAALIEKVIDRHGRLDALINNAGQGRVGLLTDLDADAIGDLVEVNLTAVADLTRLALRHLHRRGGDVVMVSSAAAWLPVPPLSMYSATKAGVDGLVAALRREQPRRIRIHSIQPGLVATEWLAYALGWRPSPADPHALTSLGIDPCRVAVQVQRCLTSSGHRTTSMPRIVGLGRVAGLPPLVHLLDLIGPVAAPRAVEWATRYGRFLTQDHGRIDDRDLAI